MTNGIHLEINFLNSSFRDLLDKRIKPDTELWSFFSTKIDNLIIINKTSLHAHLAAVSCVQLFRKNSELNETLSFKSGFWPICQFEVSGNTIDENNGMLAMSYMCPMQGKVRDATLYINNELDAKIYVERPVVIIIIEGCYFFSNETKIEISWLISTDIFRFPEVFSNFDETFYDIYFSSKINLGSECQSLCDIHIKKCREGKEEYDSGITTSGFTYFILGGFAVILIVLLFYCLNNKFWIRKTFVTPMVPME